MLGPVVLNVSYSQIVVFDCALAQPLNLWTEQHVHQGFAWREGSAAFRTLGESGSHVIEIEVSAEGLDLSPAALRVIQVPFDVPPSGQIAIASVADEFVCDLPPGRYALRFECLPPGDTADPKIRFVFTRSGSPTFAVLRRDTALAPSGELIRTASPA